MGDCHKFSTSHVRDKYFLIADFKKHLRYMVLSLFGVETVSSNLENLEYSGIFLHVYENFLKGLFVLLPDNDRKIICKNNDCI